MAAGLEDHLADALISADASRAANESDETANRRGRGPTALDATAAALGSRGIGHTARAGAGAGARGSLQSLGISVESSFDVVLGLVRALVMQQAEMNDGAARTALDTMNVRHARPSPPACPRSSVTLSSLPVQDGRGTCLGFCSMAF
jgi:hypothetical protein